MIELGSIFLFMAIVSYIVLNEKKPHKNKVPFSKRLKQ